MSSMVTLDLANNIASIISTILVILGVVIAFIAWFIRLESKVNYLEKDHGTHKETQAAKDAVLWGKVDALQATMNSTLQAVGRVEGRLGSNKNA